MGTVFGQAVSVISAQSTSQCVCRIGRAQQIAVTLHGFSPSSTETTIGRGHEFNQTIKERFSIVFSIKATCLFNGQVQHFGADNFEPCSFKARKDITNDVFATAFGLMMEKVRSIAIFTSVNCSVVVCTSVRDGADYNEQQGR